MPYLRGPEKYRDMDDVLTEVKRAADKGITEVMLLGQTVNAYKTPNADFTTLLTKVSEIGGIKRIRFTSPHPRHYTNELIDVLLNNPKVCHYAHIPLQSGSDAILKKMRRQHNMEQYMTVIEQLRSKDPYYAISTDVICGKARNHSTKPKSSRPKKSRHAIRASWNSRTPSRSSATR